MEKSKTKITRTAMCLIQKPTIGKTLCLLLIATALTLLSACSTTETNEPKWNDMYEVRSYQVETITNEIITTVFICRQTETNKVIATQKEVEDFGGYEFDNPFDSRGHWKVEYSETNKVLSTKMSVVNDDSGYDWDYIDEKNVSSDVIEFQCVDGSCEVKEK